MSFCWEDFKILAEELSSKSDEASHRTAISRFYYAGFCYSRQHLIEFLNKTEFESRRDIHNKVHDYFVNENRLESHEKISNNLRRLRVNRNKSDYDLDFPKVNSYLNKSKKNSKDIFKHINKLKKLNVPF